jgi:hypothetical protein
MSQRFMKVTSPEGEQRWINLDRVTRVTLANDAAGHAILAFCFDGQDQVKIHGTDKESRALIQRITQALGALTDTSAKLAA